jgi:hypothetical protein
MVKKILNTGNWLRALGSNRLEKGVQLPAIFAVIVLWQSLFIERSIRIPDKIDKLFKTSTVARIIGLWLIALTGTPDVESSIVATLLFLFTVYVFKSKKEKKRDGFWGSYGQ